MKKRPSWFHRHRKLGWSILLLLSLAATAYARYFFAEAYPIVSLNLSMTRSEAIERATQLALDHGWEPQAGRVAASFGLDSAFQHYVELEAGGPTAFTALLAAGQYSPYTWNVQNLPGGSAKRDEHLLYALWDSVGLRRAST